MHSAAARDFDDPLRPTTHRLVLPCLHQLAASGAFVCGASPTIADFTLFCIVRNWTLGHIDYVPTDCLSAFPEVTAWLDRVKALPQLSTKKW